MPNNYKSFASVLSVLVSLSFFLSIESLVQAYPVPLEQDLKFLIYSVDKIKDTEFLTYNLDKVHSWDDKFIRTTANANSISNSNTYVNIDGSNNIVHNVKHMIPAAFGFENFKSNDENEENQEGESEQEDDQIIVDDDDAYHYFYDLLPYAVHDTVQPIGSNNKNSMTDNVNNNPSQQNIKQNLFESSVSKTKTKTKTFGNVADYKTVTYLTISPSTKWYKRIQPILRLMIRFFTLAWCVFGVILAGVVVSLGKNMSFVITNHNAFLQFEYVALKRHNPLNPNKSKHTLKQQQHVGTKEDEEVNDIENDLDVSGAPPVYQK